MKTIEDFLSELNDLDIKVWVEGERFRCNAPKGALTADLRSQLSDRKLEIISFLEQANGNGEADQIEQTLPQVVPDPAHRHDPFPLTDTQAAYWIGRRDSFELSNVSTHIYIETDMANITVAQFEQAWQQLIERHDMLRAVVQPDGQQRILAQVPPYQIRTADLRDYPLTEVDTQLKTIRSELSHQVFTAHTWPLFEIRASLLTDTKIRLHWSVDLLIIDTWSFSILFQELAALIVAPDKSLPDIQLSFRDYVLATEKLRDSAHYERSKQYWKDRLATLPRAPELPLKKTIKQIQSPQFIRCEAALPSTTWQQFKNRAKAAGLTSSSVLLAAFSDILMTWSQNSTFTLDLTLFNRLPLHPEVNRILGDFTSVSLLSVDSAPSCSFIARAKQIQKQLLDDFDHRYFSGIEVLRELARLQTRTTDALMPIVFTSTLVNENLNRQTSQTSRSRFELGDVVYSISQTSQVYLDHQVYEEAGGLVFYWDHVAEIFPEGLVEDMFAAYETLLEQLATTDEIWQASASPRERLPIAQQRQIEAINATHVDLPTDTLLHSLFFEQAMRCPQQAGVITSKRVLTYQELAHRASQLGYQLRQLGVRPNQLVAVVMLKGWEQIVAVLGILAAGGGYVPIEPGLPAERRQYLFQQTDVQCALTQSELESTLDWPEDIHRICIDTIPFDGVAAGGDSINSDSVAPNPLVQSSDASAWLSPVQAPSDLAYVIYTSGSTGLPKGVMIDHRSACNTILDVNQRFQVTADDRCLALSSLSFDLSVYDIFGVLGAGGTLVLPDAAASRDPAHWLSLMLKHQVTIWNSVPTLIQMLVEHAKSRSMPPKTALRIALLSGDWIPLTLPDHIRQLFTSAQVISLGGATEASIWSILYPIGKIGQAWKSVPYGRPMANQSFYVFNDRYEPCPIWVTGQLYIGGKGLAKGYWQDDAKTAEHFITHPHTGERLYKTGDLGCYLPDGNIEFLGREDFQVKINGYRIELGEIEAVLEQHEQVRRAVVTAVEKSRQNRQLVAYIVTTGADALPVTKAHVSHSDGHPAAPDMDSVALMPTGQDQYSPEQTEGVLIDPVERLAFKLKQPGLRAIAPGQSVVQLQKTAVDEQLQAAYWKRQSHRQFLKTPVSQSQLSELLSSLSPIPGAQASLPKYRYPSAGNLYPVQVYVYIKPGRTVDIAAGLYYYQPVEHRLVLLDPAADITAALYSQVNQAIFEASAFGLFLIGKLTAIAPLYGKQLANNFCLLEAGYISQLLMMVAAEHQIGLCPIGDLNFAQVHDSFSLASDSIFLHSFLGGRIDPQLATCPPSASNLPGQSSIDEELAEFLRYKLPGYMVPSTYVSLLTLPLNANGKVDRQALPKPVLALPQPTTPDSLPRTETEKILANLVKSVLQVDAVGIHSNFFELGANSVHMVQLQSKLQETLGIEVAIVELFEHPTIHFLATQLSQPEAVVTTTPPPARQDRAAKQRDAIRQQQQLIERRKDG